MSMRDDFDTDPSIIEPSSLSSSSNIVELSIPENANEMMITSNKNMTTDEIMDSNTKQVRWNASNYENDYKLLKTAMSKQSAITNLHQQRRKYTLDYGFARNRRPLFRDLLTTIVKISTLTMLLVSGDQRMGVGGAAISRGGYDITSLLQSWNCRQVHVLATNSIHTISILYYWIMCMTLPLVLLTIIKLGKLGPMACTLEVWKQSSPLSSSSLESEDVPSFFYTRTQQQKKARRDKDTGNYVLCLLENWSSVVVVHFISCLSLMFIGRRRRFVSNDSIDVCSRLLVRLGAVASLHQYPSLLFELYRDDQPRPLCRSTSYMQRAVKLLFNILPIAVSSDLAMLLGRKGMNFFGNIGLGALIASSISILLPLCHLIAFSRIVRISKISAFSLSEAWTFVSSDDLDAKEEPSKPFDQQRIQWRYQLRWRTPQRLAVICRTWRDYFFTSHAPLLLEMNEWKSQQIRFDDYSTEGRSMSAFDDIPDADAIIESLSLTFRDREAAIQNATQARTDKHQESYDTKTLDDVLGVAVQQTFDIGLSYDFDHFDSPDDNGDEISIHQLRARMAKSAVRRKRELDGTMENELAVLSRLKDNAATATNTEVAEEEMKFVKQKILDRHAYEVNQMRNALRTTIPTNADAPKGTERYDSPIMVAEYVDLQAVAPTRRGELQNMKDSIPDTLSIIEDHVRRDRGDIAADAYRQDEIAARKKEKQMLLNIRQRSGNLKDDDDQVVTESEK